jgi:hypothetical protein
MDFLEQLRGNYDIRRLSLELRRDMIFKAAEGYAPLSPNTSNEVEMLEERICLKWAYVSDPVDRTASPLEIMPIINISSVADKVSLASIELIGKSRDGEEINIGNIETGVGDDTGLTISGFPNDGEAGWGSKDFEIFLTLLESSIAAQSN